MYRLKEVICFGEGAGANILARFAVCIVIVITLLTSFFLILVYYFFSLVRSSQQVFKMFSIWTNTCSQSQSLSPLVDGRVNNVLLQTARHQQGAASAH